MTNIYLTGEVIYLFLKYAADKIHEQIAKIYNNIAEKTEDIKNTSKAKQSKRSTVKSETYYPAFLPTQDFCSSYHQQNQR